MRKWMRLSAAALAAMLFTGSAAAVSYAETEVQEEGVFEVSCGRFALDVPESFRDICDIETSESEISFYERLSHEKMGGFAGKISLYEGPWDYGFLPQYARGGEIDYEDGSKMDIVWQFASDVQYDIENEDSKNNYSLIVETLREFITSGVIRPAEGGTFVRQEDIDTTGIYEDVLDRLTAALTEKKDRDALEAEGFSYLYAYTYDLEDKDPLDEIGFAYTDVNCDGYSELVIGSVEDYRVYDMFAPVNGETAHIFSSGERSMYSLYGKEGAGILFVCLEASGGAALSEVVFSILESNEPEPFEQTCFLYDAERDPENPYFFDYSWEEEPTPTTEEEWNERMGNFGHPVELDFTPLSAR